MFIKSIHHQRYYFLFLFYFVLFGAMVAVLTSIINYNIRYVNIERVIRTKAKKIYFNRKSVLSEYVQNATNHVKSVAINPIMRSYLKDSSSRFNKKVVENLFFSQMDSYQYMMKIRYIDETGMEIIRLDRKKNTPYSHKVSDLQNKNHRYYYKETSKLAPGTFWYSNLDLNLEHSKIEYPIIPTFRVSTPLYYENKFRGLIIISLKTKNFLNQFQNSNEFNIYVVDKRGYFIIHPEKIKSWSRYLKTNYTLQKSMPLIAGKILGKKNFSNKLVNSFDLSDILKNKDGAKLIIQPNTDILKKLKQNNIKNAIIIILTVFVVSLPLAFLIAYIPSRLQVKLQNTLDKLNRSSVIIDMHVIFSSIDFNGKIIHASSAFEKITGFNKGDHISKKHIFIDKKNNEETYFENIINTLELKQTWQGEQKIKTRSDDIIWLDTIISPETDSLEKIQGYSVISHNITDKKRIQEISITDQLTKVYNRHKLDEVLKYEINHSKRYNSIFSVILIDIDKFKSVNDTYGHHAGDIILIEIANLIKNNIRKIDTLGRWGGEEFLIVLSKSNSDIAISLAESLRKIIESYQFSVVGNKTASFGVSTYLEGESQNDLIKRTDKALYYSKEAGRNRVHFM